MEGTRPSGSPPGSRHGGVAVRHGGAAALVALGLLLGLAGSSAGAAGHPAPADLTGEERAWLTAHGPLRFAPDPAFPPIEWFDEEGRYRGMSADYFRIIEERIGARIEIVRLSSWEEVLQRARSRDIDGITAAQPTPERAVYLDWTPPILDIPNVVIVRSGTEGPVTLESLVGRRVAVTRGYAIHEHLRSVYPAILVTPQPDDLACLTQVSFGRVDAAVVNLAVASWLIEQHGITNLRVAADSGRSNPLAIATRNDQPMLRSIMAKGLAAVTADEREAIQARWLHIGAGPYVSTRTVVGWAAAAAGVVALVGLLVLAWNRSLHRQVAKATTALQDELVERRRAEAALRRSEGKLALHLDQTAMCVIEFDREFRVVYWNPAAERVFGWRSGEVAGRVADFLLPAGQRGEQLTAWWKPLLERRGSWHQVTSNLTRDGRVITCEWFNTTLVDDAGQVQGVMSLGLDVSERERREEALAREQRLESLAVLSGGIAHDFNNLLTGILGNLSMLRTDDPSPPERAEMVVEAEAAARRAQALTRQLLTFARGGAPVKAVLDPGPLVREAAVFATRGAAGTCQLEIPEGLWPVEADGSQLAQVVHNLVLNAFEAHPAGVVTVTLANEVRAPPAVPEGPCLLLRVSDQGPGIPADRLSRIFDPFYSTKQRGSGLGLAVTHSIVARHGGQVEVRSAEGQGTTFDVWLPAAPDRTVSGAAAPAATPAKPPGPRRRVLVMDDEEHIRRLAQRVFGAVGCEVEVAAEGNEAVSRWRSARDAGRPFDLVVLDLTVPGGMGGLETLGALRSLDPAVLAVVTSGYSSAPVMAEHQAHGFAAALAKPWSAEQARRLVDEVCATRTVASGHLHPA